MEGMQIRDGATPIVHDGSRTGVLVAHGFTGSPQSVRPLADDLIGRGFTVRAPRLPGHGTSWQDLDRTKWTDWYAEVESAYSELTERCDHVVAVGLSMGGTLATLLVQRNPEIAGLAVINPVFEIRNWKLRALPVARRVRTMVAGIGGDIKKSGVSAYAYDRMPLRALTSQTQLWHQTTRDLPQITQPVLLVRSKVDHVVPPSNSHLFRSRISSTDVTEVVLENSYHLATLDHDAPLLQDAVADFTTRLGGQS